MQFCHIINSNTVYIDSISRSKTAVLLKVSQLLSQLSEKLDTQTLFEAYWERESLGSTAIGHGITIPHVRAAGITHANACVIRLLNPVDFGAEDKQPIDLVVGLVVPQELTTQHLQLLTAIIKQFSVPSFRDDCRRMTTREALYRLLVGEAIEEELMA